MLSNYMTLLAFMPACRWESGCTTELWYSS